VERLLARLERRFGQYAPGHLTYLLIGAQLVGLLAGVAAQDTLALLHFDIDLILAGQGWRLLTWLAIPPTMTPIWALFALYWLYIIGTQLESEWGSFKFTVYWLFGVVGTIVAASIAHAPANSAVFILTLFLAFATLWPNYELRVFFFVPVKVKWLAYLDAAYLVQYTLQQPGLWKLLPLMAVGNYLLFFGPTLYAHLRGMSREAQRAGARNRMRAAHDAVALPLVRKCAICGASNADPEVDIRVCNCDKCGGVRRDLCLPHARNH
jgi:hypothetical protein